MWKRCGAAARATDAGRGGSRFDPRLWRFEIMAEVKTRLAKQEEKQLCQLLGNVRLCLLFKGSVHGFTPLAFHSKCDAQGPTLVVAYTNPGFILGGFSNEGFKSREVLVKDEKAFLFRLNTGEKKDTPLKIPVKDPEGAIYDHSTLGPNFGNGSLTFLSNGMQLSSGATASYEFSAADLYGDDPTFVECEVFRVESIGDAIDTQWRKITWTAEEKKRLMEVAKNYKPSLNTVSQARVLVVGPVGAGKSSFFNSVNSVFRGHVTSQAIAGSDATSVTTKFRAYNIKDGKGGKLLPFVLCDSMGLEEKPGAGLKTEDVPKILEGHVPDNYPFNPSASIQSSSLGYIKSPSLKDKIHCVVFVLDACKVGILSEELEKQLRTIRAEIILHDVPHIVVLTKVDELCPLVAESVENVYRSRAVEKQVNTASARLGIPVSCILPVKNYSSELELECNNDILILNVLQQIMRFSDNYFDNIPVERVDTSSGSAIV